MFITAFGLLLQLILTAINSDQMHRVWSELSVESVVVCKRDDCINTKKQTDPHLHPIRVSRFISYKHTSYNVAHNLLYTNSFQNSLFLFLIRPSRLVIHSLNFPIPFGSCSSVVIWHTYIFMPNIICRCTDW